MYDKETIKKNMRSVFNTWTEEELDDYASRMADKYSSIKTGDNVIHLEYFDGLVDDQDIQEIESTLSAVNIELSRYDKNGAVFASALEDFSLQLSLCLKNPIVETIAIGMATNAVWDAIKATALLVWKRVKFRKNSLFDNPKLNFGLRVRIKDGVEIDMNLDTDSDEKEIREALDKVPDFLKHGTFFKIKMFII